MNKETDYSVFLALMENKKTSAERFMQLGNIWMREDKDVIVRGLPVGNRTVPVIIGKHALSRIDTRMLWKIGNPIDFIMNMLGTKTGRALMKYPVEFRGANQRPDNDLNFNSVGVTKDGIAFTLVFEAGRNYIYLKTVLPEGKSHLSERTRRMNILIDGRYEWVA